MRSEMAVLSATVESLQADKNSLRTDLTATLANIDSLSAELSQTQRIRRQLELRLQANNMECELTREALLAARSQIQAERSAREREKSLAQADLDSSRKHSRDTGLRLHALRNENELLRQNVNSLRSECDILRAGNNRYVKLRSFVPATVRYFVARAFRAIRHGKVK
jgi:chromosome segregation ATPase